MMHFQNKLNKMTQQMPQCYLGRASRLFFYFVIERPQDRPHGVVIPFDLEMEVYLTHTCVPTGTVC